MNNFEKVLNQLVARENKVYRVVVKNVKARYNRRGKCGYYDSKEYRLSTYSRDSDGVHVKVLIIEKH